MSKSNKSFWMSPQGLVALLFISFPTYFLFIEHREHIFQFLPYLIFLLCPLMHLFMHGSHGHQHSGHQGDDCSNESFKDKTEKNEAYRDGYIQGLKEGRQKNGDKENNDGK